MITKTCPYCMQPTSAGVCACCGAELTENDLVLGFVQEEPVLLTQPDSPPPQPIKSRPQQLTDTVRASIENFNPETALKLGIAFMSGIGIEADHDLAYKLFHSAATRGNTEAFFYLGECVREGCGVEADEERAKFFYMMGAEKGDEKCVNTLKVRYSISAQGGGMFYSDKLGGGEFVQLVDRLYSNVVSVHAFSRTSNSGGAGSGAIVTGDYVLTNAHVILSQNGKPYENITVSAGDNPCAYPVKTLAYSPEEDIAVLGFTGERPPMAYGERLLLRPAVTVKAGEDVFTIGNPKDMGLNVTKGIVSRAIERDKQGRLVLRTDMSINPGNSGGPLFDAGGNVVGLMTYSLLSASGETLGDMSFAVTSDTAVQILKKIQGGI